MAATQFRNLSPSARAYIVVIVAAGSVTVLASAYDLFQGRVDWNWLWFALLTLASGSATVRLGSVPAAISISETFVFTSALLFGASAGALTVALDAAVISFWSFRKGQPLFKIAFNICALPLTIWIAAHLFFALAGVAPLFRATNIPVPTLIVPLVIFTIAYFSLSTWIITFAISLERKKAAFKIWRESFLWISLNYFGGAFVALLLVTYSSNLNLAFLVIVVPLLAILYATYAATVGRFEDANRHLTELNALYMATIETLAMAIDAKDQVTHGHIRRVQAYAVGLARRLGVAEPALIRAVEAAALLHDMGKLAVPEYILNKPGPLTPAEFDRMKLHASVGADILSSIKFPYPVVPIVRHHHENWDGSGYPDGLKGTDIPIGARILSVVDCFDALTSDRPYRPRLSDAEATKILRERRGTMYDPLVIDEFLCAYKELAPSESDFPLDAGPSIGAIKRVAIPVDDIRVTSSGLEDIASSTEEMLVLYELARGLAGRLQFSDAADVIAKHLRRIVPASTCVFFIYEPARDELLAAHAAGDSASHFVGLRIARGERLSGWVAANRQTIVNSDPVLDLGEVARSIKPRLRSCLSTALLSKGQLVGVLSVYSTQAEAFTEDHRRVIEVIGRQISNVVKSAVEAEAVPQPVVKDQLTGLPFAQKLESFVDSEIESRAASDFFSIVLFQVQVPCSPERTDLQVSSESLSQVVSSIRRALRGADVLSRLTEQELVVLLAQTDPKAAQLVVSRMVGHFGEGENGELSIDVFVALATAPMDGSSLHSLVNVARGRLRRVGGWRGNSQASVH